MSKKKIGLALSGGAARGLAHIGVLEVLEREGIPIDLIAGTSAGALIGALYALSNDASRTKDLIIDLVSKRFALLADLTLPRTGLIQGKRFKNLLKSSIGDIEFGDLSIPFACVATDIGTGEAVVIEQGSVIEGVRASTSIPGIFTPIKKDGRYLVDGGLVNPIPVSVLKEMGADFIIAVNALPDMRDRVNQISEKQLKDSREPNIFSVIIRALHIAAYQAVKSSLEGADIVIEPQVAHIGSADFHRATGECIPQGELAAQRSMPEIKRRLSNL